MPTQKQFLDNTGLTQLLDELGQYLKGKQDKLTFDTTPTRGSINPVTSGGVFQALNEISEYVDASVVASRAFIVTLTHPTSGNQTSTILTADKTFEEITEAIDEGRLVEAYVYNTYIPLNNATANVVIFCENRGDSVVGYAIDSNNNVTSGTINLQTALTFDSTPTANSTNPVTSGGIKTYVDNAIEATDNIFVIECSGDLNTDDRGTETHLTITNNITAADVIEAYEDGKKIEIRHTYVHSGAFDNGCIITSTIGSVKTQTENNNTSLIGTAINTGTPVLTAFGVDYRTQYLLNVQHNEQDDTNDEIGIVGSVMDHPIYIDGNNEGELILGWETLTGSPFAPKFRYYDYNTRGTGVVAYTTDLENITSMTEITYSDLVTARNNNNLKPGTWYRITDYTTTTTQANTQSASHNFDVIVLATSSNTLSEEARAIQHSGDTYFANSNLNAWKIWYCLENNKVKYAWADTTNGKGVIYRMIDEWGNDVPYDFKNIQFKRKLTDGEYDPTNGTDTWVYTFNAILAGTQSDNSLGLNLALAGGSGIITSCAENVIKPFYDYNNQQSLIGGQGEIVLNNNVFLCNAASLQYINSLFVYANKFDVNSMGNTFKDLTAENTFGSYCMNNTFGDNLYSNIIGKLFKSNTTKHSVYKNIIGNDVSNCQFNDFCHHNKFGNYISNCVFGNPDGYLNNSDSGFYDNTIGNYCNNLSLIGDVGNFTIGNGVYKFYTTAITTSNVIVENGVSYVTLDCPSSDNYDKRCTNITIAQGVGGSSSAQKVITHPTVNDNFQTIYRPINSQVVTV